MCCRKVITPKDGLVKSEEGSLAEGRLKWSTVIRICGKETKDRPGVLVKIMERFDMLVPYKGGPEGLDQRVQEYLVPCMMKRVPEDNVHKRDQQVKNVPILCFKFVHRDVKKEREEEGIFLPYGLFHRVISRCCQTNKKWNTGKIYYDYMDFSTDRGVFSLRMANDSILLCALRTETSYEAEDKRRKVLSDLREEIQTLIDAVLQTTFPNLTCVHYLECTSKEHEHRYKTGLI